ncbi:MULTISPECIES: ImmA/IrrE family metallo-endopeptidase [Desulfosporosinus]|uniref:ImmA/IrrE family metallo-endopeptidase n=1 Tax=Desulfosporosinus TaxID=79206 RepID=UPI001F2C9647|nr:MULTISPECIES: ImmA/IrrE family metallo-endopeptidase [Desulfosporosinus]
MNSLNKAHIYESAEKYVRRFGTRDPFAIADGLGIEVLFRNDFAKLKGLYRVIQRNRFIFLNNNLPEQVQTLVCAHELGHDAHHRDLADDSPFREYVLYSMNTRPEYEANLFAASLLLPDNEVHEYAREGYDVVQISAMMNTDINLMLIKMGDMNSRGYSFNTAYTPLSDFLGR